VDLAKNYAMLYHNNIKNYIAQEILKLCAEIRESVLETMPDPAKAYERAYQQSFGCRNYMEVLEYVLDVNAYVEKLFLVLFYRKKAFVVDTKVAQLRERVTNIYQLLRSTVETWSGKLIASGWKGPEISMKAGGGSGAENSAKDSEGSNSPGDGSGSDNGSNGSREKLTLRNLRGFFKDQQSDFELTMPSDSPAGGSSPTNKDGDGTKALENGEKKEGGESGEKKEEAEKKENPDSSMLGLFNPFANSPTEEKKEEEKKDDPAMSSLMKAGGDHGPEVGIEEFRKNSIGISGEFRRNSITMYYS
jgi:hypothetical protein